MKTLNIIEDSVVLTQKDVQSIKTPAYVRLPKIIKKFLGIYNKVKINTFKHYKPPSKLRGKLRNRRIYKTLEKYKHLEK